MFFALVGRLLLLRRSQYRHKGNIQNIRHQGLLLDDFFCCGEASSVTKETYKTFVIKDYCWTTSSVAEKPVASQRKHIKHSSSRIIVGRLLLLRRSQYRHKGNIQNIRHQGLLLDDFFCCGEASSVTKETYKTFVIKDYCWTTSSVAEKPVASQRKHTKHSSSRIIVGRLLLLRRSQYRHKGNIQNIRHQGLLLDDFFCCGEASSVTKETYKTFVIKDYCWTTSSVAEKPISSQRKHTKHSSSRIIVGRLLLLRRSQ